APRSRLQKRISHALSPGFVLCGVPADFYLSGGRWIRPQKHWVELVTPRITSTQFVRGAGSGAAATLTAFFFMTGGFGGLGWAVTIGSRGGFSRFALGG